MIDPKGYERTMTAVSKMSLRELFEYLDTLEGRDNLPRSCSLEVVRAEALMQTERKYSNMTADDVEREYQATKTDFASSLVPGRRRQAEQK